MKPKGFAVSYRREEGGVEGFRERKLVKDSFLERERNLEEREGYMAVWLVEEGGGGGGGLSSWQPEVEGRVREKTRESDKRREQVSFGEILDRERDGERGHVPGLGMIMVE